MHINDFYPTFIFQDQWHRLLKYEKVRGRYYRSWLNTPKGFTKRRKRKEISKQQFAFGLLCAIEKELEGVTAAIEDVKVEPTTEAERDLEAWFGPRKDR